ncbi:poly-beta-1,6 N-acetyl-D-glucosamine export porin PgaA [Lysobacteraceae bacterium NML93-0792]|nr:poly-beta-1,6 N-acetyl-D-glucosamine export porin PgaA [Xanthomonadaceae bacterium NML93-0792]PBS16339.1 poly-beta-1,6 N-acetyl-D-glucosamine export porin PgaA [Xanthomonadaceae bacterium NML93-0793]PBS19149.1 poly-beta-1,6 N-acetyl-D-glucosamine export porin PgaA [Xanthomonadaceae bacterium NML93-0831]
MPPSMPFVAMASEPAPAIALEAAQRTLALEPADDEAFRSQVLALDALGASALAAERMRQRPQLFADHERERIEGDAIARAIGWGRVEPISPETRLAETRAALAQLEALQRDTPRRTNWEATRLRVDALSALNHLQRHAEVVAGYHALLDDGIEVPAYILATVGDSLLALRRPADAIPLLEDAMAHAPHDVDARILLGYAFIETERFDRALPLFEALATSQDAWPRDAGARSGYENWDRYSADLNHALAHSYANDHARAEAMLQSLIGIAPYNPGLQAAYGAVQSRRLRPAAALERYDMALTMAPQDRDALAGRVGALTALDRSDQARDALSTLQRAHPEDPRLKRVERELDRHRGVQATLSASRGRSRQREGAGTSISPFGSRDGAWALEVRSPLIDDRWRVGVFAHEDHADFIDGRVRHRAAGMGAWYRHDRLGAWATLGAASGASGGTTATLGADWRFNDAWRTGLELARNAQDTSLQARRLGIEADSATLIASYAPSDTFALQGRLSRLRYDDGNSRDQLGVDAAQRVLTRPHLMVDGLLSAYTSRGSRGDTVGYFNPERDASATIGLRVDHITWRRYETAFQQRVDVMAGPYWQRDAGTHWVPSLGYRHLWRRDGHELEYGVAWSRPVYDGLREQRVAVDVELRWGGAR